MRRAQPFHPWRRRGGQEDPAISLNVVAVPPDAEPEGIRRALLDRKERKPSGQRPKGEKAFGRVRRIVALNEGLKSRTVAAVEGFQKRLKDFTGRPCRNRRLGESGDDARTEENDAKERQCQSPQD
jgi:hypothetical protein